jgi:hypothetical protein
VSLDVAPDDGEVDVARWSLEHPSLEHARRGGQRDTHDLGRQPGARGWVDRAHPDQDRAVVTALPWAFTHEQ